MIDINERYSEKRNFFNRLLFVYIFFGILFLYLIYKTFSLQVSSFTDYELASLENKTREFLVQPRRGIIYDRNGKIIVNNQPSYNLILNPERVDDVNKLISEINKFINLSDAEIRNINDSFPNNKKLNREVVSSNLNTLRNTLNIWLTWPRSNIIETAYIKSKKSVIKKNERW